MKYCFYFFLFLVIIFSCKKDSQSIYWGEASAKLNGVVWEGEPFAGIGRFNEDVIYVSMDVNTEQGFNREHLYIFKIPHKVGEYQLRPTNVRDIDTLVGANYYTALDDGDVLGDSFDLLNDWSLNNRISITKIEGKEVWGEFQAVFVKDTTFGESQPEIPDTLVFTDGQFHTRIRD